MSDSKQVAGAKRKRNDPDGPGEQLGPEVLINMPRAEEAARVASIKARVVRLIKVAKSRDFTSVTQEIQKLKEDHDEHIEIKTVAHVDNRENLLAERRKLGDEVMTDAETLEEAEREHHIYELIKLPGLRKAQKEEAEHIEALAQDVRDSKKAAEEHEAAMPALRTKLSVLQAREKKNHEANNIEKHKCKDSIKWGSEMKSRGDAAKKEVSLFDEQSKHELDDLKVQLGVYGQSQEETEANFRREFATEVEAEVTAKKTTYQAEIAAGLAKLEHNYEHQQRTQDDALQELVDKNSDLENQHDSKTSEVKRLRADHSSLQDSVKAAEAEVARLNAEIYQANDTYASKSSAAKAQLKKQRVEKHNLDRAYDDLMDVRVALDQEIDRYKSLLDNEEDRLNYVSPHKN